MLHVYRQKRQCNENIDGGGGGGGGGTAMGYQLTVPAIPVGGAW